MACTTTSSEARGRGGALRGRASRKPTAAQRQCRFPPLSPRQSRGLGRLVGLAGLAKTDCRGAATTGVNFDPFSSSATRRASNEAVLRGGFSFLESDNRANFAALLSPRDNLSGHIAGRSRYARGCFRVTQPQALPGVGEARRFSAPRENRMAGSACNGGDSYDHR